MTLTVMPKYEAYKDSGVEWLGDIPEHWDVIRLKNAALINPVSDTTELHLDDEICFLPMEKVGVDGTVEYDQRRAYRSVKQGFTSFKNNDVIIAKITPCFENGKGAHLKSMPTTFGYGSTEFHVLRANERFNPAFLYYLSKSHSFMDLGEKLMTGSAGQKRVPTDFITEFRFASPSFVEQTAIANFLDAKTAQIDEAIAIKEQQIALLNERKQILIQQAVTQGLDPTVPMKDSGVEWIGKIPEHWEIKKVKHLGHICSGDSIVNSQLSDEGLYEVFGGNGLMGYCDNYNVEDDSIIIGRVGALCGNVRLTNERKWISDNALILKLHNNNNYTYISDILEIADLNKLNSSNAQPLITGTKVLNFNIPIAPYAEQQGICEFIKLIKTKHSESEKLLEEQINRLKEYKTTLINSAVTGKIKVV